MINVEDKELDVQLNDYNQYHIGYNYELQKNFDLAIPYMQDALMIFQLVKDHRYTDYIEGKIRSWQT